MNKSKETTIITNFSTQHPEIRNIIQRHWHLLRMDPSISKLNSEQHQITFRRARSLKDRLVHSHYQADSRKDPCGSCGTFPCNNCNFCKFIDNRISTQFINGQTLKHKHFVNCRTKGVIYLMMCKCQSFYVGKTKRELRVRISEQIRSIRIGDQLYPISRQKSHHHGYDLDVVKFIALDRVHLDPRGGDWGKKIL